jgi:hypothetical protein
VLFYGFLGGFCLSFFGDFFEGLCNFDLQEILGIFTGIWEHVELAAILL